MILYNKYSKEELKEQLDKESFKRITFSFYRYVIIDDPHTLRDQLYVSFSRLNALGRIYIAHEGINAQMTIPEQSWDEFVEDLYKDKRFKEVPFKIAVEDDGKSFYKLVIKVRKKIVADGLDDNSFDITNVGQHLTAKEFNDALSNPDTIVVDMRNHYESEVGHFERAICPDADTFKQELPMVLDMLKDKKENKILLYCTGGIRCEKASAYLKHFGFKDINQLYGGIISYAWQVKSEGLSSKFKGKNFVFDNRLGEKITDEIISTCHQCGILSDLHTNCANDDCHLLFIQCERCAEKYEGCCTPECQAIINLPVDEQRKRRKGKQKKDAHAVYKSRLRPNLREVTRKRV